nr:MAG TPA: hypothetical protein [Caudoviricetes sp.]
MYGFLFLYFSICIAYFPNTDIFMRAIFYPMREKNLSMRVMRSLCVHFK